MTVQKVIELYNKYIQLKYRAQDAERCGRFEALRAYERDAAYEEYLAAEQELEERS